MIRRQTPLAFRHAARPAHIGEMTEMEKPPLGEAFGPRVMTVTVNGALGAIPLVGGLLAEIAGQLIPQQRVERIESYWEPPLRAIEDPNRISQSLQASLCA